MRTENKVDLFIFCTIVVFALGFYNIKELRVIAYNPPSNLLGLILALAMQTMIFLVYPIGIILIICILGRLQDWIGCLNHKTK